MIESKLNRKLKAKNCNPGKLFQPSWSLQHSVASYEVISWSTDIHIPANADGDDLR